MIRLKTHLITGGRFYKAGLYREGDLPKGFGEVAELDDEPVRSEIVKDLGEDAAEASYQQKESVGLEQHNLEEKIEKTIYRNRHS